MRYVLLAVNGHACAPRPDAAAPVIDAGATVCAVVRLPRIRRTTVVAEGQRKPTNAVMPDAIPNSAANQKPPRKKYRLDPDRAAMIRTSPPVLMDLKEASAYLVCSPRKLRDLVTAGRVKHARVGAKIVIRREWLDAFLGR